MASGIPGRFLCGIFAVLFVIYVERGSAIAGKSSRHHRLIACVLAIVLAIGMAPSKALAAAPLVDGTVVRVASSSIDAGRHKGRMHLDAQKCWMVKLDKATKDGYTMVALIGIAELQVAHGEGWTPINVQAVVKSQPAVCMEYNAD